MDGEWAWVLLVVVPGAFAVGLLLGRWWSTTSTDGTHPAGTARPEAPAVDADVAEILDLLRAGAVVTGADARVLLANAAAEALGLVRGDRLVHARLEQLVLRAADDGVLHELEIEVARPPFGATTASLRVRAAPLARGQVLLVAEDRTEARRAEEIRRDFVVNVSHELKTPVGALALLAETVGDAADDPEVVRRFTGRMQQEAHRLATLVHDIIELSRLQDAGGAGPTESVAVADVVQEAVERSRVPAEGRAISLEVGPVPAATVLGDRDMLVTAVRNLLDNAIGYSDPGTRVAVGTTLRPTRGVVEIAVVDQGIGIPAEALPRIFERFYRVDPARSRDTGGTGLGLSIVKHVAADHGGEVTVWSRPGQGSTFTLRLPVTPTARLGGTPDPDARHGRFTARRRRFGPDPNEGATR